MSQDTLTIGELARRADLNPSAIRYYERIGLMPEPVRVSGQRRYGPEAERRLGLLQAAKRAGFTLDETQLLLDDGVSGPAHAHVRELAERKLPEVEALIAHATEIRDLLSHASNCEAHRIEDCEVLSS